MSTGVPNFYGERLKQARVARGLFKNALADMIGVTPMAITRYEADQDKPLPERLDAMASKLNFPVDFFMKAPPRREIGPVFWRHLAAETKTAREMTVVRMEWLCEVFDYLEAEVEFPALDLPAFDVPADISLITPNFIENCAQTIREWWGMRNQPIPDMMLALENSGIPVVALNIPSDKQDGFTFRPPEMGRPFVGINVYDISCARARFDAAHELGHIVLHRHVTSPNRQSVDGQAAHKLLEGQAHRFAGALLFPKAAFIQEVRYPSLDYFAALKKRWGMSIGAMVMRASDLGLIESDTKRALYRSMAKRKWRGPLREPFDSETDMPVERPRMLRRGFQALLDEGLTSKAAVRSALPIPVNDLEEIAGLPPAYLQDDASNVIRLRPRVFSAVDLESGNVVEFPGKLTR